MTALRKHVRAVVHLGGFPDWQTSGDGSVFVANDQLGVVHRIDEKTNTVVATLTAQGLQTCDSLATGFGSLWVPDCSSKSILRFDLSTNRLVAHVQSGIASDEGSIAVGAGSVWVVSARGELSRIDPGSNKVVTTYDVPAGSVAVAFGFGSLWVTDYDRGTVTRLDPSGVGKAATIQVGFGPRFLAAGEGAVWVLNQSDGTVSRIDPATNQVQQIDAQSAGDGGWIATGLGSVWVTVDGTPLTRIDGATGRITEQYTGVGGDCVSAAYGSVWLSNNQLRNVWRIDPASP
jgi:streptogramin lyase